MFGITSYIFLNLKWKSFIKSFLKQKLLLLIDTVVSLEQYTSRKYNQQQVNLLLNSPNFRFYQNKVLYRRVVVALGKNLFKQVLAVHFGLYI